MTINEILASGKSMEEQARAISAYYASKARRKAVDDSRRSVRAKCFVGCKNLTKAQQESFLYEFLSANSSYISNWMQKNHPEIKV